MMDNQSIDLTICQKCKENPATYGDGLTWSLCSKCNLEKMKEANVEMPKEQESVGAAFEHKIVEGLTSIIIPVYLNSYSLFHYTGNCIGSIREHTPEKDYELVIIDNGSTVKPPSLNSYYAHRVIQNEKNLGVTKAWNQGIRTSVGEYIVLMNNDVQVFDHWLNDLRMCLESGGLDLVMAHPMYSLTEPFSRAVESIKIRNEVINKSKEVKDPKEALISDFKDFSCVMFKRSLVDEIGLFDEDFFNYCSDSDFFKRLEEKGKKWGCCEAVPTSHLSDATGYTIAGTAEILNKDKETYKQKWDKLDAIKEKLNGFSNNSLFRTNLTGDSIYLKSGKTYHHIKSPEVLHALGFDFGQEQSFEKLPIDLLKGEDISMENYKKYV